MTKSLTQIQKNRPKHKSQKQRDIEDRRASVYSLRTQGESLRSIAKELSVSEATIRGDLKIINAENAAFVSESESNEVIGEIVRHYENLVRHAWSDYNECDAGSPTRAKFLSLIRGLRNDQYKVYVDVGVIRPIAGEDVTDITKLSSSALRPEALEQLPVATRETLVKMIVQQTTTTVLQEPELNPITVSRKQPTVKVIDITEDDEEAGAEVVWDDDWAGKDDEDGMWDEEDDEDWDDESPWEEEE